jgi:BirA family transcriptional regulator, biotin operon repressor / biotin---[acetyl-CoA-carboxylase] ligase
MLPKPTERKNNAQHSKDQGLSAERLNLQSLLRSVERKNIHAYQNLVLLSSVDSTQDWLAEHSDFNQVDVCIAEHQSKGRGQYQREWLAPFGSGVWMSIAWSWPKESLTDHLSLRVGKLLLSVLQKHAPKGNFVIKAPNDILLDQQKCAGILIETSISDKAQILCGIGINVLWPKDQDILASLGACDLSLHQPISREALITDILAEMACII